MITWPSRRALVFDGVVAAVLTTFCVLIARSIAEADAEPFGGWAVFTIILIGAALVFRRVAPELVLAVVVIALGAYTFADFAGGPIYLASILPLYTIAASGERRRLVVSLVATAASFVVIALISDDRAEHLVFAVAFTGWVGGAVFLGTTQYNRRAYLAQLEQRARDLEESEEEARRWVAEERLRIARDLHDIIAHGIATIHMQSSVALHVLGRHPEQAEPALAAVKLLSRQTLEELRATLDVLRADDPNDAPLLPTPGLDQLGSLVETTRQAGLPVDVRTVGSPEPLPTAVDVAAYRIVQESLTNVMRHGGESARATVTVSHGQGTVELEIVDDGLGAATNGRVSDGHGIVGMGERAATVGGTLAAAPRPGGGFRVHARLPTNGKGAPR